MNKAGPFNRSSWLKDPSKLSDQELLRQWQAETEAGTLSGFGGQATKAQGEAKKLFDELDRRGVDTSSVKPRDFSSGRITASDATNAMTALQQNARPRRGSRYSATGAPISGRGPDAARGVADLGTKNNQKLAQMMQERDAADNESWVNQNVDPAFQQAQDTLNQQAGTDAISAEQESAMRTKIGESVRLQEEGSLRRASSVLGLRGLDPSSPAGAALAARAAERADATLNDAFRELGLSVLTTNRQSKAFDAMAATQIATSRLAAHSSLSADRAGLVRMQTDVGSLIDALHQRRDAANQMDQQQEIMRRAMEGDDGGGMGGTIGTIAGGVLGSVIPGVGTAIGAAAGGALGGAFDGSKNPAQGFSSPQMLEYLSGSSYGGGYKSGSGYNGTVNRYSMPSSDINGNAY